MGIDHAAGRAVAFGLCMMLSVSVPVAAQTTTNLGVTGGIIEDVTLNRGLTFGGGSSVALWGLQITDLPAAQAFLKGRKASCMIVTLSDTTTTADCSVAPKSRAVGTGLDWLNLLVWLPELGVARLHCNALDVTQGIEWHPNKRFYRCDPGTAPYRKPPSPPTAPRGGLF